MVQSPVRFAILGFGGHAVRRLMPAFPQCKQSTMIGMWRRDQAAAAKNCAEYKIPHCFSTREELCASPDVDVVFITSPDAMHRDDTLLALKHGKAVLCEKPLAMSAGEAEEMNAAAKAAGTLFGVGQNFRFNRNLVWMREQIAAGRIGTPLLAHAQYSYPAMNATRKWITDPTLALGGPIADVGVHCIDALRFVLGEDVVSISTLARKDEFSGEVDAVASLQLEMTGGVYATADANGRGLYRSLVEVTGSEGVMVSENALTVDRPVEVVVRKAGEMVETRTFDNGDGYTLMLDSFAQVFRQGGSFAATAEDGIHNMRAVDSAYTSWRSGARETV
jgi:1,5-anhydro-D-fructose reductase (1,5-anhydro-D-mannitol-forming)